MSWHGWKTRPGDQASARQHYEDFLDRWGDADLTIPAVAEAKDRLAILTP